jgi:P-type Cu2+ transporter
VTPWVAALGMAGSSLLVTLNALRLSRAGRPRRIGAMPRDALHSLSVRT